jgi:hypothetical protein
VRMLEYVQDSIYASELAEDFRNKREEYKKRWCDLLLRRTGDPKAADREMKRMATDEVEAKIDAGK